MVMTVNTTIYSKIYLGEEKTDVIISYLFNISMDFLIHFSTYDLGTSSSTFYDL
jgi:hypothetical protein